MGRHEGDPDWALPRHGFRRRRRAGHPFQRPIVHRPPGHGCAILAAMVRADLLAKLSDVERYADAWDSLALAAGEPYCQSAWMLAWWREAAPAGARLRVAVAREDDRLVGIAPFYGQRRLGVGEWLRPLAT